MLQFRLVNLANHSFSPLTANIYFPAIPTISSAFHKSTELINLTVTVYMVVQGICAFSKLSIQMYMYILIRGCSAHVLGYPVRPLGQTAYVHRLHDSPFRCLRGTSSRPHGCLLVTHGPSVFASGWFCQHRWVAIAGMVGFRNNVGSAALTNWVSPQGSQIAFGRGMPLTLSPTTSSLSVFLVLCRCARLCGHQQRRFGLVHHLLDFSA